MWHRATFQATGQEGEEQIATGKTGAERDWTDKTGEKRDWTVCIQGMFTWL